MPGKKICFCVACLLFFASCEKGKVKQNLFMAMAGIVDSTNYQFDIQQTEQTQNCLMATEVDELFDDFIFNYVSDTALQRQRTRFPLPYKVYDSLCLIREEEWKHNSLFLQQNMYMLLFDHESDMDVVGDTTLLNAQVEWFYLKDLYVKRYKFERYRGIWMLTHIELCHIEDGKHDDFHRFYARFMTDSVYQRRHVQNPLPFITLDPDDEFAILETTLDIDQWFVFRPTFPIDSVFVIDNGQRHDKVSTNKIVKINGIGNGFSNVLYFKNVKGEGWQLCKFEDTSI